MQKNWNFYNINILLWWVPKYHNFYCSLVVWTCTDLHKIWLWPPESQIFKTCSATSPSLIKHVSQNFIENWTDFPSHKHIADSKPCCRFIKNLKHSFYLAVCLCCTCLEDTIDNMHRTGSYVFCLFITHLLIKLFKHIPVCAWTIHGKLKELAFL